MTTQTSNIESLLPPGNLNEKTIGVLLAALRYLQIGIETEQVSQKVLSLLESEPITVEELDELIEELNFATLARVDDMHLALGGCGVDNDYCAVVDSNETLTPPEVAFQDYLRELHPQADVNDIYVTSITPLAKAIATRLT